MYDYIIEKPELNEETLAHYGIKGMKWRKKLKGKYYSLKSKVEEYKTKKAKGDIAKTNPEWVTGGKYHRGAGYIPNPGYRTDSYKGYPKSNEYDVSKLGDKNAKLKSENVERGIAAGRERVKKKKK